MKTKKMMKSGLVVTLSIGILSLSACSTGTNKETAEKNTTDSTSATAVTPVAKAVFEDPKGAAVYEHYLHLKDALIKADVAEVQTAAAALQTALTDAGNSKGADIAGKIASTGKIDAQRAELEGLSEEVETVVKAAKIKGGIIYKQYCPMANAGKGGYWLSSNSDIRNPYYGDEMLNCGETKEEIK